MRITDPLACCSIPFTSDMQNNHLARLARALFCLSLAKGSAGVALHRCRASGTFHCIVKGHQLAIVNRYFLRLCLCAGGRRPRAVKIRVAKNMRQQKTRHNGRACGMAFNYPPMLALNARGKPLASICNAACGKLSSSIMAARPDSAIAASIRSISLSAITNR